MLTLQTKRCLVAAIANQKLADEIEARLISSAPTSPSEAQALLSSVDESTKKKIEEYLIVALANRKAGQEIAKKINGMIDVIKAQADGNEVSGTPAVAASFTGQVTGMTTDVTIDADVEGAAGNVTLTGDGVKDIDTLIADWNLANPGNELVLSSGDGSQIPDDQETITLSGGADEVLASDANLAPAKAAMGSDKMSQSTYEILVIAMASRPAAKEFKDAFDTMIDAVQAI